MHLHQLPMAQQSKGYYVTLNHIFNGTYAFSIFSQYFMINIFSFLAVYQYDPGYVLNEI